MAKKAKIVVVHKGKRRKPQDATLRNVRATRKRTGKLLQRIRSLETIVHEIENRLNDYGIN